MKKDYIRFIIIALRLTVSSFKLEHYRNRMKKLAKNEESLYSANMERAKKKYLCIEKRWYVLEKEYLRLKEKMET